MQSTDCNPPRELTVRVAESAKQIDAVARHDRPDHAGGGRCGRLHRLQTVRERERISRRVIARRLGIGVAEVKRQEDETRDIVISQLLRWQEALNVPLVDLLVDPGESLSPAVRERAALLRTMKTAKLILKLASDERVVRLARMLTDQLATLMPELRDVSPWPTQGQQRTNEDYGVIFDRRLPDEAFAGLSE